MTKITIPREALKAAARAIEEADIGMLPSYEEAARAACLALIQSWPNANWDEAHTIGIILPLPTEPEHD